MSIPGLTTLLKQSEIDDHDQLLEAANAALKTNKDDLNAQHIKAVALLKLDRFEDAVRAIETGDARLKENAKLEYAYALYKSDRAKDATDITLQENGRGFQHIRAQALYSTEEFAEAARLYSSLSRDTTYDNDADLRVNSGAADAQLEFAGHGHQVDSARRKASRNDLEAYETAYNAACGSIARGELGQAEILLKRAKNLCQSLVDLSDAEKEAETLPMTVQEIYVLSRLGRPEEARQLVNEIDAGNIADVVTRHLAKINSTAVIADDDINPYMVQRQTTIDESSKPAYRPFKFQTAILKRNEAATVIKTMKYEGIAAITQRTISKVTAPTDDAHINSLSVTNAAAHARNQTGKEALKQILSLLERRPNDVGLILTIVQLYVLTNNGDTAIDLLQKFFTRLEQSGHDTQIDVRFAPALVGCMVSLYTTCGRRERARLELAQAAKHWRKRTSNANTVGVMHLLKTAGSALLESQDKEDRELAKSIFEQLHKQDDNDRYAAAGLLAASPSQHGQQGSVDSSVLVALERLTGGVDAEALENAGIAIRASVTSSHNDSKKRAAPETTTKQAKKIRKSKMPKDYDPAKTPDPERWLPLRDRSTYRPKGKKGKARQAMFSQGAVVNESDGSRPTTPGGELLKGKNSQSGGGSNANKKKKGKKK